MRFLESVRKISCIIELKNWNVYSFLQSVFHSAICKHVFKPKCLVSGGLLVSTFT